MTANILTTPDYLKDIKEKEELIAKSESELAKQKFELQELKRLNASTITIQWKESVKWCLSVDQGNLKYFIKTPAFVAKCIAQKHGVDVTRDIKNKIATTLSAMFNAKLIGRISYEGKTYYGLPEIFEKDLTTLKAVYSNYLSQLRQ